MAKVVFPKLHRAFRYAAKHHKKQERDGTSPLPYISHPTAVASLVRYVGHVEDEDVLCAAVLHDVVEEGGAKHKDLVEKFGERTADLVKELTRDKTLPEGLTEEEAWMLKTKKMLDEVDAMTPEAKLIKLADRTSNLEAAVATRSGADLYRYIRQSQLILGQIPAEVAPMLHQRASDLVGSVELPRKYKKLDPAATPALNGSAVINSSAV